MENILMNFIFIFITWKLNEILNIVNYINTINFRINTIINSKQINNNQIKEITDLFSGVYNSYNYYLYDKFFTYCKHHEYITNLMQSIDLSHKNQIHISEIITLIYPLENYKWHKYIINKKKYSLFNFCVDFLNYKFSSLKTIEYINLLLIPHISFLIYIIIKIFSEISS